MGWLAGDAGPTHPTPSTEVGERPCFSWGQEAGGGWEVGPGHHPKHGRQCRGIPSSKTHLPPHVADVIAVRGVPVHAHEGERRGAAQDEPAVPPVNLTPHPCRHLDPIGRHQAREARRREPRIISSGPAPPTALPGETAAGARRNTLSIRIDLV